MSMDGSDGSHGSHSGDTSDDEIDEDLDNSPLARALSSLSPSPAPHNTPDIALNHIASVLHENTRLLECRLGAVQSPSSVPTEDLETDNLDVFRHPIAGDILPSHDILCKITKRVWRRVQYTQTGRDSADTDEPDSAVKEYSIELLGPISNTVRFRRMADFAFQPKFAPHVAGEQPDNALVVRTTSGQYGPDVGASRAATSSGSKDSPDHGTVDLGGSVSILKLQSMLRRMDFEALSKFRFAEPHSRYVEDDEGDDGATAASSSAGATQRSVAYLVPPPIFSRQETPFPYHYKHAAGSNLVTIPNADGQVERRYMNVQHYRGAGPTGIMISSHQIPQGPDGIQKRQLRYIDRPTLEMLKKMFDERPIWSRLALLNQFEPDGPFNLFNSKFYLSHVAYIIYDGPFRDCLVRYGYDPRVEPQSRFYQRIQFHFRSDKFNTPVNKLIARRKKKALLQPSAGSAQAPQTFEEDESDQEGDADGDVEMDEGAEYLNERRPSTIDQAIASTSYNPQTDMPSNDPRRTTHIFDGISNPALTAMVNYSLIDITDPMLRKYIYVEGKLNIRSSLDMKTGWYTKLAFERMKTAITTRVKTARFESRLATAEEVEAAVMIRMGDLRRGRSGTAPGEGEEDIEWWADHVDEQMMASTEPRDSW